MHHVITSIENEGDEKECSGLGGRQITTANQKSAC
jgi:hypothetical protein